MRAGICTGITRVFEIRADVDWMKRVNCKGIVLGRRILFSMPAEEIPIWLFRHEVEHAYQQIREGRVLFYLKYFYYSVRYGYHYNPYEIQARDREKLPLTDSEEQALWKLREDSQN